MISSVLADAFFYGDPELPELEEEVFERWFMKIHGIEPMPGDRLPDPEFLGLAVRYTVKGQ